MILRKSLIDTHRLIFRPCSFGFKKLHINSFCMETYTFSGKIQMGKDEQKFEREVEASSEEHAKEKLLSELGSEHSVTRGSIQLE